MRTPPELDGYTAITLPSTSPAPKVWRVACKHGETSTFIDCLPYEYVETDEETGSVSRYTCYIRTCPDCGKVHKFVSMNVEVEDAHASGA